MFIHLITTKRFEELETSSYTASFAIGNFDVWESDSFTLIIVKTDESFNSLNHYLDDEDVYDGQFSHYKLSEHLWDAFFEEFETFVGERFHIVKLTIA